MSQQRNCQVRKTKIIITFCFASVLCLFYISAFKDVELKIALSIALGALVLDVTWLNKLLALIRSNKNHSSNFHSALDNSLRAVLKSGYLYQLTKSQLFVVFYAFFAKHFSNEHTNNINSFSYASASNSKDVFWVVAIAQLPTLPFIHFFVEKEANVIAAWVVTALTIWSVIYYLAQVQAVKLRPIELTETTLNYKFGLAWEANIQLKDIKVARKLHFSDKANSFDFFISPIGSNKNILLEFYQPITFVGCYFLPKRKSKAVISIDNTQAFLTQLASRGVPIT